ncbi:ferredoxin reductase [Speluncibacter jeojiensis]|uniref:ferredoxin reductase n=1 Tax=Speluncibacter jeojiensis TaxID=2710754 RepID=UPI00240EA8F8|nr:ferredoxin reductase [Rhodococcus sp. D2-41]
MALVTERAATRGWLQRSALSLMEAMVTPHRLDRYLELVYPMWTATDLRAEITAVHRSTPGSITLTLRPTRQWTGFAAGQFVRIGVVIDGVRHTRCYSPVCSQYRDDGRIELTVKAHPDGLVSQYLNRRAHPGMVVDLAQASGTFRLPDSRPAQILLISGGSGITPVLSMLRTLDEEGYTGDLTFLHYTDAEADVVDLVQLRQLAAAHPNLTVAIGCTADGARGDLEGFFGVAHLEAVAPWFRSAQTFLCGPPPLMRSVAGVYDELGLADRLHTEDFAPAPSAPDADATGRVSFTASDVTADNSGATLLEQAEAAGLRPEYGCRMGICFSCTAVKTSGCTRNIRTGDTDADPGRPIQLCINVPVGDVDIDI